MSRHVNMQWYTQPKASDVQTLAVQQHYITAVLVDRQK